MKLLGISASNRKDGNSYHILKETLPSDAVIIHFADFGDLIMHTLLGTLWSGAI